MKPEMSRPQSKSAQREATTNRILNVAERLFAASGFDSVSVSKIAIESGIQLSLILYHFKTKEGLYKAVFERSAKAIAQRRHDRLEQVQNMPPERRVESVLQAFCGPWVDLSESDNGNVAPLFARALLDHSERQIALVKELVDPEAQIFIATLRQAAPAAPEAEIHRCYHLFAGALVYFVIEKERISRLSGAAVADVRSSLATCAQMIAGRLNSFAA